MKSQKNQKKQSLRNDLDWLNTEQELVHEPDGRTYEERPLTFGESLSRGFRSTLAVIICIVIPALWYFDWNPSAMANETSEFVTDIFDGPREAPVVPAQPSLPVIQGQGGDVAISSLDMSMVDYAATLNDQGILEEFSGPAVRAFYENNVTVNYLEDLQDAGLIEEFSFPAVVAFYQNQVPFDYLRELGNANMLEELSFPAIVSFYQNNVPLDYLRRLNDAGILSQSSFPAVVAYHQNGVTIEFLNELVERDLLDNLSFPDVVNMYQAEQD